MLIDEIRAAAQEAMKQKDTGRTTILRLALGEIQTLEARLGHAPTDEEARAVVRKLIKSNEETIAVTTASAETPVLLREIEILRSLLPASLSVEAIVALLQEVAADIKASKGDGQATGVAMKHLKQRGVSASGTDVARAVKAVRG